MVIVFSHFKTVDYVIHFLIRSSFVNEPIELDNGIYVCITREEEEEVAKMPNMRNNRLSTLVFFLLGICAGAIPVTTSSFSPAFLLFVLPTGTILNTPPTAAFSSSTCKIKRRPATKAFARTAATAAAIAASQTPPLSSSPFALSLS